MKYLILSFVFIFFFSISIYAQQIVETKQEPEPCNNKIDEKNRAEFDKVVINKVKELGTYITRVARKDSKQSEVEASIKQAKRLFKQPDTDVRISTTANGQKYSYNVDEYFAMLSNIKSMQAEFKIDWANYYYATEYDKLKQGADGRWYGTITVQQCFEGLVVEGKAKKKQRDCKNKTIEIIMEINCVRTKGNCFCQAAIVLGDIDISQTQ